MGPDAAGARSIVADCDFSRSATLNPAWKDGMGIGTEALEAAKNGRDVRERLCAAERDVLRQRISTAVRERELTDVEAWKEIKTNGRTPARQRP